MIDFTCPQCAKVIPLLPVASRVTCNRCGMRCTIVNGMPRLDEITILEQRYVPVLMEIVDRHDVTSEPSLLRVVTPGEMVDTQATNRYVLTFASADDFKSLSYMMTS